MSITFIRNMKYGIRNLIDWFPVIWSDRNWDYWYIYKVFHKKLSLMEKNIRVAPFVSAEKQADEIKLCVNLLDRLIKDEYLEMTSIDFDKKWGKSEFKTGTGFLEIVYKDDPNNEHKEQRDKEQRLKWKHEEYLIKQDLNMLFSTMAKKIRGWWD